MFDLRAGGMRDFEVYWTAAGRAASAEPLYREEDGHFQFKYLPAFALLGAPIARLSLERAKDWWFVVSVGLIPALLALAVAILPERRRRDSWLYAVTVVIMAKFFGHELVLGQVNLLFAVIATAAIFAMQKNSDVVAGVLIVAAIVIKPYAVIFLPWIAMVGGGRAWITTAAGIALVALAPVPWYGVGGTIGLYRAWSATVAESTAPNLLSNDNVSLAAFFAKWMGVRTAASALTLVSSVALLIALAQVVIRGREIPRREALEGSLILVLIPLLSPQGWDYVFLIGAPAIVLYVNYEDHLPTPLRVITWIALVTVGFAIYDLLGRQRYATFMAWSVITLCFIVLTAALVTLRVRRAC